MEERRKLLEEEITNGLLSLSRQGYGNEGYGKIVKDVETLYNLIIEEDKVKMEFDENREKREFEEELRKKEFELRKLENDSKLKQMRTQKILDYTKIGVEAAGIILPLMFYGVWMKRGFEFEKEGVFTSTTFRNLYGRFKPKK